MRDLLERLVACWPKDSEWEIEDSRVSESYLGFWKHDEENPAAANMDASLDDIDNAPACVVIEEELMKNEGHVAHLFSGDLFTTTWWRGDRSVAGDPCNTRTEALVTVAVAVFGYTQEEVRDA